ncbi:MAG: TonB-dependent receptor, partial [Acidobacteria bacterium]|nr:TonB-dependent receptor [Acidobacteriota bacterium]
DRLVNGFKISGITTLQTGFPIGFVANTDFNSLGCGPYSFFGCPDRPNFVGPYQTLDPRATNTFNKRTGSFWFNPAGFTKEAIGTIGNARRNMFHGPGLNNTDLAIEKDFRVDEHRFFELRLEAYNAFNHTQFGNPNSNVDSSNFGRIQTAGNPRLVQLGAKFYF